MARLRLCLCLCLFLYPLILALQQHSLSAAQSVDGFQSINCGGEAYNDSITKIPWEGDPLSEQENELGLFGRAGKVDSRLKNITPVMTTLRYFPEAKRNIKSCYSLEISSGNRYLLRASFLYGNYDKLNNLPSFALLLNYDVWTNVTILSSTNPIVQELIFVSMRHNSSICLAPYPNSNHTPFISTLELRLLDQKMYITDALIVGYGLVLWHRINYGAKTSAAIRYPDDVYDRIWEANTTGPTASTSVSEVGSFYGSDPEKPPPEVMATAITTTDAKGNLSFTYQGFGGDGAFRVEMHFQDVDEATPASARTIGLAFPGFAGHLGNNFSFASNASFRFELDGIAEFPRPLQITLFPLAASPRGPLLNAIELFTWTPQPLSPNGTNQVDVEAITEIQEHFQLMGYGQGDPCTPNDYAWSWIKCNGDSQPRIVEIHLASFNLTGDIPPLINNLTYLQIIDLSNNMLSGEIPNFSSLSNLQILDLSNNMLSGEIPNFSPMSNIRALDLHNNNLNGPLPPSLILTQTLISLNVDHNDLCGNSSLFQKLTNFTYIGNPNLCNETKCHCLSSSTSTSQKSNTKKYKYAIWFLGALYIVSMLTLFLIYMARRSKGKEEKIAFPYGTQNKGVNDLKGLPFTTRLFTYNEICNATLDFTTMLGEGGFGKVYHGLLPTSGEAIAVKTLADASKQGIKEFSTEVAILSRVRHKNLVSLIGYCTENTYMLIYEYIAKGNLRDLIYGEVESTDKPLPWTTRLQIALDASQGLDYLHTGCDPPIFHRDVKSSNILLSDKMQAKVSDFGLSRLKEGGSTISHVSTVNVVGTAGYLDPAYNATSQLTDKSDVYSFGVVLFELICGRAPIDMYTSPPHIVDWVTPSIVRGKLTDIVDPNLTNGYKVEAMWKVVDVAFGCVENDRVQRPKMSQVMQVLREALEIEIDPNFPPRSHDVSASSSTSVDAKLPTLQYIESLRLKLEPR